MKLARKRGDEELAPRELSLLAQQLRSERSNERDTREEDDGGDDEQAEHGALLSQRISRAESRTS